MRHCLAGRRPTPPEGHLHGVDDQLGADVVGDRPPHYSPAPGVEDHGQVDLALRRRVLGHVHDPETVRLARVEVALHQVLGRGGVGIPSGATPGSAPMDPNDPGLGHEPGHPFARTTLALPEHQLGMDPR